MDYGFKASEPGHDVFTAEDKNLSLKTGFTIPKVFKEGIASSEFPSDSITHNLGYEPQFLVWVYTGDGGIKAGGAGLATGNDDFGTAFIDDTSLSIFSINDTLLARYYIFYEELSSGGNVPFTSTSDYGLKMSKDGKDILEANILDQTFNSEKNTLKIQTDKVISATIGTDYNFIIPHNLGKFPAYMVYYEVDDNGYWFSENENEHLSGKDVTVASFTTSKLLVCNATSNASCIVKIRYVLFADLAT